MICSTVSSAREIYRFEVHYKFKFCNRSYSVIVALKSYAYIFLWTTKWHLG